MAPPTPIRDVLDSLSLALIATSDAPILLLNDDLVVVAASKSFYRAFHIEATNAAGKKLAELGHGEWDVPQLQSLLRATVSGSANIPAYEMDLKRPGREERRLVLKAQILDYADSDSVRVLLTVLDVTDARLAERLKDDLLREKAILLQELQHRVANSLQIIASVLMQSARRVQSDETRTHLYDAHQRVMSVATLQKQLAASTVGNVALKSYFTDLCHSIGASMIRDQNELRLSVNVDESIAAADISVSLGLIVTELVINALKHAFPGQRNGKIVVDYHSLGQNWTLSVADNGVGMPVEPEGAKAGLGTSIVEALSKQLKAKVQVTSAEPGTCVSVIHQRLALVESDARTAL